MLISRPSDPDTLKELAQRYSEDSYYHPELSKGEKGAIIGTLTRYFNREGRYKVFKILFDVQSSKDLNTGQWAFLKFWLGLREVDPHQWLPCEEFFYEHLIFKRLFNYITLDTEE